MVEHLLCKQGVGGSSPLVSTIEPLCEPRRDAKGFLVREVGDRAVPNADRSEEPPVRHLPHVGSGLPVARRAVLRASWARRDLTIPKATKTSPKVATASPSHSPRSSRFVEDRSVAGSANMRVASITPRTHDGGEEQGGANELGEDAAGDPSGCPRPPLRPRPPTRRRARGHAGRSRRGSRGPP